MAWFLVKKKHSDNFTFTLISFFRNRPLLPPLVEGFLLVNLFDIW